MDKILFEVNVVVALFQEIEEDVADDTIIAATDPEFVDSMEQTFTLECDAERDEGDFIAGLFSDNGEDKTLHQRIAGDNDLLENLFPGYVPLPENFFIVIASVLSIKKVGGDSAIMLSTAE